MKTLCLSLCAGGSRVHKVRHHEDAGCAAAPVHGGVLGPHRSAADGQPAAEASAVQIVAAVHACFAVGGDHAIYDHFATRHRGIIAVAVSIPLRNLPPPGRGVLPVSACVALVGEGGRRPSPSDAAVDFLFSDVTAA